MAPTINTVVTATRGFHAASSHFNAGSCPQNVKKKIHKGRGRATGQEQGEEGEWG